MNKIKHILETLDIDNKDLYSLKYKEDVEYLLSLVTDLQDKLNQIKEITDNTSLPIDVSEQYDPEFGDDVECLCGHPYYRHFDPYDDMEPVGCKYCSHYSYNDKHTEGYCPFFKEKQ